MTEVPPHFHTQDRIDERSLIPDAGVYVELPVTAEEGRFAIKLNGSTYELYKFLDGAWRLLSASGGSGASDDFWTLITSDFESVDRFVEDVDGGAVGTITGPDDPGITLVAGDAASNGWARLRYQIPAAVSFWTEGARFGAVIRGNNLNNEGGAYAGLGTLDIASAHEWTDAHAGFKVKSDAAGHFELFATQADGTTETASAALVEVAEDDLLELALEIGEDSITYYYRKNGGALLTETLATNIPTGAGGGPQFSVSCEGDVNPVAFDFMAFYYKR